MATSGEPIVDHLDLTIEEEEEEEPSVDQAEAPTDDRKAVFKGGLLMSLISIGGILNLQSILLLLLWIKPTAFFSPRCSMCSAV